jgi:hypothetical protein
VCQLWKAREVKAIEIIERQWIECESVVELTALRIRCYLDGQVLNSECVSVRHEDVRLHVNPHGVHTCQIIAAKSYANISSLKGPS